MIHRIVISASLACMVTVFQNCSNESGETGLHSLERSTAASSTADPAADPLPAIGPAPVPAPGPANSAKEIPPTAIANVVVGTNHLEKLLPNSSLVDFRIVRFASGPAKTVITGLHWGRPCQPGHVSHAADPDLCLRTEATSTATQFITALTARNTLGMTPVGKSHSFAFIRGRGLPSVAIVAVDSMRDGQCSPTEIYDYPGSLPGFNYLACLRLSPITETTEAIVEVTTVASLLQCPNEFQDAGPLQDMVQFSPQPIKLCVKYGSFARDGRVLTHLGYGSKINGECADGDVEVGTYSLFFQSKICARY